MRTHTIRSLLAISSRVDRRERDLAELEKLAGKDPQKLAAVRNLREMTAGAKVQA